LKLCECKLAAVGVYLRNTTLVRDVFCYQYLTFNDFREKYNFLMKFGNFFRNLLKIKCTKLYSDQFRFDIFIAQCLLSRGLVFLPDTV